MNRDSHALASPASAAAVYDRGAIPFQPGPVRGRRSGFSNAARAFFRLPSLVLLGLIKIYQRALSPALPIITMGRCGCRFSPTCSHYAAEAIRVHGAIAGVGLAFARLIKCTPLHPGGIDPVPPRRTLRCTRTLSPSL